MHIWIDASCEARLDIRDDHGQHVMTINVRGEGTSPRASTLSNEEREVAFDQAARYAAFNAADMITPVTPPGDVYGGRGREGKV